MAQMSDSRNWFKPTPSSRRRHLLRSQRHGIYIEADGKRMLNFASNDYLGLATHPAVMQAACNSIAEHGLGSGASRLISGDDPLFHQLESRLAEWKGFEDCLLLGSGMLANIGLLQALADRHTHIFADRLNHASLVDGARLSGARCHRFSHLDMNQLETLLQKHPAERRIIVCDGVFSMDGDCADLNRLMHLAETSDTLLIIDDAHGTGTVGPEGRGLTAATGIAGNPRLIEVGTLGKAFGSYGAFILGSSGMIEGLRQHMRTLIYSTALPAALPAAALAALDLIRQGSLLEKLHGNLALFREQASGLPLMPSKTPIQPLVAGKDERALAMAGQLKKLGFFVPAIRPPTVPEGSARLRITLSAAHSLHEITQLVEALESLA
ncbi:MAG: 8-amino-7-oxononanoate synthase [Mariprofundaceae bacterium]|nr:8-amino-7-oxononanoate synthase [Mariprofundaceae bacterium]